MKLDDKANRAAALAQISVERDRQDDKWGEQNHEDLYWLGILMEEVGEVSKALIDGAPLAASAKEVVEVAAVAVCWLECRTRRAVA